MAVKACALGPNLFLEYGKGDGDGVCGGPSAERGRCGAIAVGLAERDGLEGGDAEEGVSLEAEAADGDDDEEDGDDGDGPGEGRTPGLVEEGPHLEFQVQVR